MLKICGIVDIGVVRKNNQDKILINNKVYDVGEYFINIDDDKAFVAVADGIGGQDAGEIASEIVLQEFSKISDVINEDNYEKKIKETSNSIYEKLLFTVNNNNMIKRMGSTITGAYINDKKIITFNLGDSRTYIFKNSMLNRLTKDDSEVQMLIDIGVIDEEDRNNQNNKNIITKFFGTDVSKEYPTIRKQIIKFQKGDIILLCSDGLTDYLKIDDIEEKLKNDTTDIIEKTKNIKLKAIENGSKDNISIILIEKV